MQANRYDRAAEAPIMNTYVPINFDQLYRVGSAQRETVDQAAKELSGAITTFGQFQSPSTTDTQNYYNQSIGRLSDLVQEASSNPDAMKDANFRSRLQSRINNLDYSALSMLKESAENQRLGLKTRAQMEAEGRYNKRWDTADIPNYDTLASKKVFSDITPMRFMTADELANSYFSNLKPSTLGSLIKDGVKYQRQGITYDTLLDIADAKFNDIVSTPQGHQYYTEALEAAGGDKELARQAFVGMIADSQRDRIMNQDTVDPYWLAMAKQGMSGQPKVETQLPTRQEKITYDLGTKAREVYGKLSQSPSGKQSERLMQSANKFANASQVFAERYQKTQNEEDLLKAVQYKSRAEQATQFAYDINRKAVLKDEFERIAQFGIKKDPKENKEYSRSGYLRGVEGALDKVSSTTELAPQGDPLLTRIGGTPQEYVTTNGLKTNVYQFNNSQGFLLPETVFQFSTETEPDKVSRRAGVLSSKEFPFRELIEQGRIRNVQFTPNSINNTVQVGSNKLLSGTARIPAEEVERVLGTGMLGEGANYGLIGKRSTRQSLQELYNMTEVEYGKDGKKYYEVPIYKVLPSDDNLNYWDPINQLQENTTTGGGIGGATQAAGMHPTSIESILRNSK